MDSKQTIKRSIGHFFSGTLISRFSGLARDMGMAYAFGAQGDVAAFFMALRFAHLFRRLLGEGALAAAFIPHFEELRADNPKKACQFFIDLYLLLIIGLLLIIIIGCGLITHIIKFWDISPGTNEILVLTAIMLPSLLFICLYGLNTALMQCYKQYFTASVAPVGYNIIWIISAIAISWSSLSQPMYWLGGMIVFSCVAQWGITVPGTLKILKEQSVPLWPISWCSKQVKNLARPLCLGLVGVGASQINNALDTVFARYAEAEGPALLWYAIRIQQVPLALFGIALSSAILPPLSRALKAGDYVKYRSFLNDGIKYTFLLMSLATAALFAFGGLGISWFFGHGNFSTTNVVATTHCLWAYGIGLVPMALVLVLAPAFYAQKNYSIPTRISVFSMILNIGLNTLMVMGLGLGSISVALATSISAWVNCGLLYYFVIRAQSYTPRSDEFAYEEVKCRES